MTSIHTHYLVKKYPKFFKKHKENKIYHFGFECENGWFNILNIMFRGLNSYCKTNNIEYPQLAQVKEKFGTLRVYFRGIKDENIYYITSFAENISMHTCEKCGDKGSMRSDLSWVRTLCDKHYKDSIDGKVEREDKIELKDYEVSFEEEEKDVNPFYHSELLLPDGTFFYTKKEDKFILNDGVIVKNVKVYKSEYIKFLDAEYE